MTTYTWIGVSGPWTSASFWTVGGTSNGSVPGTLDNAIIAALGTYTVSILASAPGTGAVDIANLTISDPDATLLLGGANSPRLQVENNSGGDGTTNAGTIDIGPNGDLGTAGTFVNTGVISLDTGSALVVGTGEYTISELGTIDNNSGTFNISGTLENAGAVLIASQFGDINVSGIINGGTLDFDNGLMSASGTLNGVTVLGPLFAWATIEGGLTLLSSGGGLPGSIDLGNTARLSFPISQTLDNVSISMSGTSALGFLGAPTAKLDAGETLTLGPNVSMTVSLDPTSPPTFQNNIGGVSIISLANIVVTGPLFVQSTNFTNEGLLQSIGGTVELTSPTTVNSGTIVSNSGTVIIQNSIGGTGTLALTGNGLVTLDNLYGQQAFTLSGSDNLLQLAVVAGSNTMQDFAPSDTIEVLSTPIAVSFSSDTLSIEAGTIALSSFVMSGVPGNAQFSVSIDSNSNSFITETIPCFAAGTRVLTVSGEVTVEALALGDVLVAMSGRLQPARWIGHRHIEPERHPKPQDVLPVRVQAHAFGPGKPHRDLLVSPDHALFLDGALVPVRHLINGSTIVQEPVAEVTYYHVELAAHDVILAEGLPCESYLDTGNRAAFDVGETALKAAAREGGSSR